MSDERAALDIDGLLKIILVLVIIWLVLDLLGTLIDTLLPGPLSTIVGLVLLVVIVAWYFDVI